MIRHGSRMRRGLQIAMVGACLLAINTNVGTSDDDYYEPGPVMILHEWLGEECSFVPDLDVGECCRLHDIAYQIGGNSYDRYIADIEFRQCLREHNRPIVARIYFWGVRNFGWLFFNYN